MRIVELYCGIGGVSAALEGPRRAGHADVVAAVDVNTVALGVYRHNFCEPADDCSWTRSIESLSPRRLEDWEADLWWASPPCQPFTRRGLQKGLDDPRAQTFLALLDHLAAVRPATFAMENVVGFETSAARGRLVEVLQTNGYSDFRERILCPSDFGLPNRRPRYYAVASRRGLGDLEAPKISKRSLADLLADSEPSAATAEALRLSPQHLKRYDGALHIVSRHDPQAVTGCFTSAYGRSHVRSGSFLRYDDDPGAVRRFTPQEILRLLDFPATFTLPPDLPLKNAWRLVGNSLSLAPVRHVLGLVPGLFKAPA